MNQKPMSDDERNQRAEQWLDSALDRYTDAEPRPGFDVRMLARVAEARERRPRWRAMWMWAAVAAAAVVLVVAMSVGRKSESQPPAVAKKPMPSEQTTIATAKPPENPTRRAAGERAHPAPKTATVGHPTVMMAAGKQHSPATGPKQPQFPTPAPLNEQERLLLAYVNTTPRQEIETVIAQKQAFEQEFDKLGVPEEQEKSDR